ncbi:MAG: tetratricopeptide repeat-containing sensor histidine kinase [Prolixibacteraceae bacterium]|nr:tetratricopeptide repeat-containing sensor histidine kinase [Prolixibacteraceae bacterium]
MRLLYVFIGLLFATTTSGQTKVDSLLSLCEKASNVQKTTIYLELVNATVKDSSLSNRYNKKAFELAVANKQLPEQATSVYYSARILYTARDFTEAIKKYQKALEMYRQLNDTSGMTKCYRYIGISNFNMSRSKEAIASYLEGIKLAKRDLDYTAELLGNIGLVHNEMDNVNEAISYFRKAININQTIHDTASLAIDYDYLGATYSRMKMPDSSLINYHKALYLFKKVRQDDRYAVSLSNMAWILPNYPDSLNSAINYFNLAWRKFQELGWLHYEPNIQFGIANILGKQGKLDESISAYKKSIQLANQFKRELFLKKQLYQGLSEVYQKKGDYKHALEYRILSSQYNDSITEKQKLDQIANLEKQYETEKKQNEIIRLQAQQDLTDVQLQKNRQLKILGFVTAALLLIFVFYVLIRYYDKIKLNQLLEQKNKTIEQSENELKVLNASKNKFFSIIAHDLKNPFHTVMGYSWLLSKDYEHFTEDERRKFASDIHHSTNNIFRLLQNLLEWSRSQTGRLIFSPRNIEFKKIIENSVSVLRSLAEQKNIEIKIEYDNDLILFADPLMIETVLRNLINNAIKFTPENGLIEVSAIQITDQISICVKDSGIGISEEDARNLFQIDSTVKRKGTNNEDGSGLGLILCKEFVYKNNGTIWVNSSPGVGSSFYFTIPAKSAV